MTANTVLINALRIFDLAEALDPDARDRAYRECHRLIKSMESGTKWYEDAEIGDATPLTVDQQWDADLISAALAIQQARVFRCASDPHHYDMARLRILAILGDDAADAEREAREQNAATITRLELGLHPTDERWL
jgi:hypothetical protein